MFCKTVIQIKEVSYKVSDYFEMDSQRDSRCSQGFVSLDFVIFLLLLMRSFLGQFFKLSVPLCPHLKNQMIKSNNFY